MIVIHKPHGPYRGQGIRKNALVVDLDKKYDNPSYRVIHRDRLKSGEYLTVDHNGYKLTRGKSDLVRVLPEEQEKEYREIQAEIVRLQQRARDIIEEGWVRAEPYIHPEPAEEVPDPPKVTPETQQALDRLGRELGKIFAR